MSAVLTLGEAMVSGMTLAYHAQEQPGNMAVVTDYGERTFS